MPRILLVDDEELVIRSVRKLLIKQGYEVDTVQCGADAVRKAREGDYDLLITDMRMPGMDGVETIREIRRVRKDFGRIPIPEICVTGFADEDMNRQAHALGVLDYIYKPFDLSTFVSCVRKCILSNEDT